MHSHASWASIPTMTNASILEAKVDLYNFDTKHSDLTFKFKKISFTQKKTFMAEILIRSNNSFLFFGKRRIEVEWSLALAWAQSRASDWLVLKGLAFFP